MEKLWKSGYREGYTPIRERRFTTKFSKRRMNTPNYSASRVDQADRTITSCPLPISPRGALPRYFTTNTPPGISEETPDYMSRFTVDYYVDEVEAVRQAFWGEEKVFLVGHSWGAILGYAYALKYQQHLKGLIASSGLTSVRSYLANVNRLRAELPWKFRKF